jgi:hypothetical protein
MVHIESEDGEGVLTFTPTKEYQLIVLCSTGLKNSVTYTVFTGGSSTGMVTDGLYSGGIYTAGTEMDSFKISSMVTTTGFPVRGFPGSRGSTRR